MKKLILSTALILISLAGKLYAQDDTQSPRVKRMNMNKAEQTFNAREYMINIRDFVVLRDGKMTLELFTIKDYSSFRDLDSILRGFMKDIAFYKDSLSNDPTGNMRIDYVINSDYTYKKIRVKKYHADGNIFLNKDGAVSRLKFEQDTVRIIIQKTIEGMGKQKCTIPYEIQATLLVDNYYDVDRVIVNNSLPNIIDTLEKRTHSKRSEKNIYGNPVSIIYNPYYAGKEGLVRYGWLMGNENNPFGEKRRTRYITVPVNLGVGLLRNSLAPMAEVGIQYNRCLGRSKDVDILKLSAAPYFMFDKGADANSVVHDNWFINADIESIYESNQKGWLGKAVSFGVGYLVVQKGNYFSNTTFKVFTDLQVRPRFTIMPEVLFTNNGKQIFPGFTLKVF